MSGPGDIGSAAFPQLGTEFTDAERQITIPWYRLLVSLWRLAGGSQVPITEAVYFQEIAPGEVEVVSVVTGPIGLLQLLNQPGQPATAEALGASPFIFDAPVTGTLSVFAGESQLSRDAGLTYFPVSLTGAAVPVLKGDLVKVSWAGATAPQVIWYPSNT